MKRIHFLIAILISGLVYSQNQISTVDFIKIKNNNTEEALHYYKENWEKFRKEAKKQGYIKSYRFTELKQGSKKNFDLMAITTYQDDAQLAANEDNFQKIMKTIRPNGPLFLNNKRPSDFKENLYSLKASIKLSDDSLESEILKIIDNIVLFSGNYMSSDYEALANSYCENAMILPPGADIITGKEAIKKRWELPEGVKVPNHKITPIEINIIGDAAYDIGYYEGKTIRKDESEVYWKGKYLIIWKKENGEWKIYADAWNRID